MLFFTKHYPEYQIQKRSKMGRACNTAGKTKMDTKFWMPNLRGKAHLEDLGIYGRIILKWYYRNKAS
jgi:hypothetical protein